MQMDKAAYYLLKAYLSLHDTVFLGPNHLCSRRRFDVGALECKDVSTTTFGWMINVPHKYVRGLRPPIYGT